MIVAVILAVSVGGAVTLTLLNLPGGQPEAAVVTQRVTVGAQHVSAPAMMTVRYRTPTGVLAPPWQGIVRKVWVQPGGMLSSGDKVATVGADTVRALATSEPLYRTVRVGDTGSDVTGLRSALAAAGASVDRHGAADRDLRASFIAFSGIEEPRGVVARPQDVVWLPRPGLHVAEVMLTAGQNAPALGSAIVSFAPVVSGASIPEPGNATHATVTADVAGTTVHVIGGHVTLDAASRQAILAAIPADGGSRDGLAGANPPSSTRPAGQSADIAVTVTTSWADAAALIPTAAILTDHAGRSCVVFESRGSYRPALVTAAGSSITTGTTVVLGLEDGEQIVLNPTAAGVADACA